MEPNYTDHHAGITQHDMIEKAFPSHPSLSGNPNNLRVETYKSEPLTREQIEGEGWEHKERNSDEDAYGRNYFSLHIDSRGHAIIDADENCRMFCGTISNIHQFRTLMQMLGIK